jgi:enamine deaminase RidA (YjgF/YER057c/UK114 family)
MYKSAIPAAILGAALIFSPAARSQTGDVKRVAAPGSIMSSAVWVGDTVYLSGTMAPAEYGADKQKGTPAGYYSDTKAQSIGAIKAIQKQLQQLGLDLGDVVQMQAFVSGDPAKGGRMDLEGWNEAYKQFFGTPEQPNKPVRATVQVAGLVLPTGRIEIMVVAARHSQASQVK